MQLYIHIPFCKSKCEYCDFNSYKDCSSELIYRYLIALNNEILTAGKTFNKAKLETIYIGGGTPSVLESSQIVKIQKSIFESFDTSELKEFTIECNPESITLEKLQDYKNAGINRISIGVQSLDDNNLKSISRLHTSALALEKVELAKTVFDNISCDLIVGLAYDTEEIIKSEVNVLSKLCSHISVYELSVEEGTKLFEKVENELILLPDDDETQDLFEIAMAELYSNGFTRYEISNFAKDKKYSLHNLGYWTREEYLGFGAGAHSLIKTKDGIIPQCNQIRYANDKRLYHYIASATASFDYDNIPRVDIQVLTDDDIKKEKIMLGLRTMYGIDKSLVDDSKLENIEQFFMSDSNRICLNDRGMAVMNSLLLKLID